MTNLDTIYKAMMTTRLNVRVNNLESKNSGILGALSDYQPLLGDTDSGVTLSHYPSNAAGKETSCNWNNIYVDPDNSNNRVIIGTFPHIAGSKGHYVLEYGKKGFYKFEYSKPSTAEKISRGPYAKNEIMVIGGTAFVKEATEQVKRYVG